MTDWSDEVKARLRDLLNVLEAGYAVIECRNAPDIRAALEEIERLEKIEDAHVGCVAGNWNERALRAEAKLAEARGESSVLVGCPCRCHTSFWDDPHLDCRECVRGTWIMAATLERVDADHDWALWHEKWIAALDLMGSQSDRATKAEAKLAEEQDEVETYRQQVEDGLYKIWPIKPIPAGEYAVVEFTEGKMNIQIWDFSFAPSKQ